MISRAIGLRIRNSDNLPSSTIAGRSALLPATNARPIVRTLSALLCLFSLIAALKASADEPEKTETIVVFKANSAANMIKNGRTDVEKVFFEVPSKYIGHPIYVSGGYAIGFAFKLPWPSDAPLLLGHDGVLRGAVNWAKPRSGLTYPEIRKLEDWPNLVGMQDGLEVRDNGKPDVRMHNLAYFLPNTDLLASGAIVCKGTEDHCRMTLRTLGFYTLYVSIPRGQIGHWRVFARLAQAFVTNGVTKSEAIGTVPEALPTE